MINPIFYDMLNDILETVNPEEIDKWVDMELIHTGGDREAAKKIVNDHILEHGIKYYPALIKMENELKTQSMWSPIINRF